MASIPAHSHPDANGGMLAVTADTPRNKGQHTRVVSGCESLRVPGAGIVDCPPVHYGECSKGQVKQVRRQLILCYVAGISHNQSRIWLKFSFSSKKCCFGDSWLFFAENFDHFCIFP